MLQSVRSLLLFTIGVQILQIVHYKDGKIRQSVRSLLLFTKGGQRRHNLLLITSGEQIL
jgi:hypothetical protein